MAKRSLAFLLVAVLPAGCALAPAHKAGTVAAEQPAAAQPPTVVTVPPTTASSGPEPEATSTTATTVPSTPSPPEAAASAPPARPASAPIPVAVPPAGEVLADVKQLASEVALQLVTYDPASVLAQIVAPVTADPARRQALAVSAQPLYHPGKWSKGTVVYPQMGGFRAERASVMVVVRQEIGDGEQVELTETRTLDVRLARTGGTWVFEELASSGGDPIPRPADLAPQAAAVVDDPRIQLPDSARWDIYRGQVAPALLRVMAEVAQRTPFGVVVLSSGHPHNVFGTNRQSNHTRGRAMDVYLVGAARVADDRSLDSAAYQLARWLVQRTDLSEVGSPWRLGPGSFTDIVHQDHLHVAVRSFG